MECIVSIDWLAVSISFDGIIHPIPNHTWVEYSPTNVWCNHYVLLNDRGSKVATLLYHPKSSIINSRSGMLEVANEWFYHGLGASGVLKLLKTHLKFDITSVSRVDICADFCPDYHQQEIIEGLATGQMYVQKKRNGSLFWSTNTSESIHPVWRGYPIPHCNSWGHKSSQVKWKLYYKTKELLDAVGGGFMAKPYIVDVWRMYDFDITNVWRLEVSIHKGNSLSIDSEPITIDKVLSDPYSIFFQAYTGRFVIRRQEFHRDKSNDTIVPFLTPSYEGSTFRCRPPSGSLVTNGRVTLLRHLVQSLDEEAVLFDKVSRQAVLSHIESILTNDGLYVYFERMVGCSYRDWVSATLGKVTNLDGRVYISRANNADILNQQSHFDAPASSH